MEYYENEEFWFVLFKLRLLASKDPRLKPKKADEFKRSFENSKFQIAMLKNR